MNLAKCLELALPSGRRAGESLTEGVSPSRGCDRCGPTATIKSVAKLDHHLMENGSIFHMKFNPHMFEDENIGRFIDVMKTYFEPGGFPLQVNVVDKQTLLDARGKPEQHRDLVVRVAGYSAYFVEQSPRVQEHTPPAPKFHSGGRGTTLPEHGAQGNPDVTGRSH